MSLRIEGYASYIGAVPVTSVQNTNSVVSTTEKSEQEHDTYISSLGSEEEVLPCECYNDILKVIQNAKAEGNQTDTFSETAKGSGEVDSAGGTGGGGSSSESEEETTTEIVVVDGITYLETTTVINGITSVTRTVLSGRGGETEEIDNRMSEPAGLKEQDSTK